MVSLTAGISGAPIPSKVKSPVPHHHIRLCEDSAQRLLCRVQEELCLRAVEGGGLPYPGQQAVLQRGGDIQVFTALRGQDDTEMGDRQAIVPHIGFELEGSLLDAAADENRPGLPQAAAGLRRLLQGLGPRRQDDGSTAASMRRACPMSR